MSYNDVKKAFHETMDLDPLIEKISSDVDLLDTYYSCKTFAELMSKCFENHFQGCVGTVSRL